MSNRVTDDELVKRVNDYVAANPKKNRNSLLSDCQTSQPRVDKLIAAGLILKYPPKLAPGVSGRMSAGKDKGWRTFKLKGSPR